jgi:hypothetical protein
MFVEYMRKIDRTALTDISAACLRKCDFWCAAWTPVCLHVGMAGCTLRLILNGWTDIGFHSYPVLKSTPTQSQCLVSKRIVSSDGLQKQVANFSKAPLMILIKCQGFGSRDDTVGIATACGLNGLG